MDVFTLLENQLGFFLLIFARISGLFSTALILGSRNVPTSAKAGLALTLSYILLPIVYRPEITLPEQVFAYGLLVIKELLVGLILGWVSSLIFSAVQMAGQLLDMQIGFGIVNVFDPQFGQQVPLIGNFKYILALIVFLSTNGHHILLSALFASFKTIPITGVKFQAGLVSLIVDMVMGLFTIALKIALPVLVALLLTDTALGVLARVMPQINIFVVGIPGKILVGIFVLSLALPFYIIFLEVGFNAMYADIYHLLSVFR